jgi:hypothetical protein
LECLAGVRTFSTKPPHEVEVEAGQWSADLGTTHFEGSQVDSGKSDA